MILEKLIFKFLLWVGLVILKELIFNCSNFGWEGMVILRELTCKSLQICMGVMVLE